MCGAPLFASFPSQDVVLPAIGRVAGSGGSQFYTTLWVTNTGAEASAVEIAFLPPAGSIAAPPSFLTTLAAGETKVYENAAETLFGVKGLVGAARVRGTQELLVSARIYNKFEGQTDDASQGLFYAGVPAAFGIVSGQGGVLQGARVSTDFRYNLFLVEAAGAPVTLDIEVVGARNEVRGRQTIALEAFESRNVSLSSLVSGTLDDGIIRITGKGGTGRAVVAGSQIANSSQDATGFEMSFAQSLLGGAITAIVAGDGLTGGGSAGSISLSIAPGAVVRSINGLADHVRILGGDNVHVRANGSAIEISADSTPGPQGLMGPQGIQGLTGSQGATGAPGPAGATGATGTQGSQGIQGVSGAAGATGSVGAQGVQGPQGLGGPQGAQGLAGGPGPQGAQGLVWRGAWSALTSYGLTDAVSHNGSSWIATAATTGGEPGVSAAWNLVAQRGDFAGTLVAGDGVSLTTNAGQTTIAASFAGSGTATTAARSDHKHDGSDVTTGTVAAARIDPALTRDTEVMTIVTAADGAGSGLDADMLDGLDSTAFAAATHTHADATPAVAGFLSAADKTKLDGLGGGVVAVSGTSATVYLMNIGDCATINWNQGLSTGGLSIVSGNTATFPVAGIYNISYNFNVELPFGYGAAPVTFNQVINGQTIYNETSQNSGSREMGSSGIVNVSAGDSFVMTVCGGPANIYGGRLSIFRVR